MIGLVCRQALQAPEDNETWGAERVRGGLERKAARRFFSVRATMLLLRENRTSVSAFPPAGKCQPQQLHRATASPEVQKRNSLSSLFSSILASCGRRSASRSFLYDILRSKLGCSDRASGSSNLRPRLVSRRRHGGGCCADIIWLSGPLAGPVVSLCCPPEACFGLGPQPWYAFIQSMSVFMEGIFAYPLLEVP